MRIAVAVLLGAFIVPCACTRNDSDAAQSSPNLAPAVQDNGQTGSPNYVCIPAECATLARETVASLSRQVTAPTFVGSRCHPPDAGPGGVDYGVFCRCDQSDGGSIVLSDANLGCLVRGRGGFCIFDHGDYAGCDSTDPSTCESMCSALQARLESEAANTYTAEVRFSGCLLPADPARYSIPACGTVLRVDGRCYTNNFGGSTLQNEPVDCALSDEEILSRVSSPGAAPGAAGTPVDGGDFGQ